MNIYTLSNDDYYIHIVMLVSMAECVSPAVCRQCLEFRCRASRAAHPHDAFPFPPQYNTGAVFCAATWGNFSATTLTPRQQQSDPTHYSLVRDSDWTTGPTLEPPRDDAVDRVE